MTKREERLVADAWQCFGRTLRIVLRKHKLVAKKRLRKIIKRHRRSHGRYDK